jgi:hypothetical protein
VGGVPLGLWAYTDISRAMWEPFISQMVACAPSAQRSATA